MKRAAAAVLFLSPLAWAVYDPLRAHTLARQARLRAAGAHRVKAGPLMAWERDTCAPGAPCRCAALVHGLGDSALTWDIVLKEAPSGWKLLALELPGSEGSEPAADYGIPSQARILRSALEGRCSTWLVAGNSLGGWIASTLALEWPQGVSELVLLGAAGVDDPSGATIATARLLADPTPEGLMAFEPKVRHKPRSAPPRVLRAVVEMIRARPARATVEALRREDLLDKRLSALKLPVRILWGKSDGVTPLALGERFHKLIRGSTFEIAEACGHIPQQECADAAKRAIFLPKGR